MNRRERRAALARGMAAAKSAPDDIPAQLAEATMAYQERRFIDAEVICKRILVHVSDAGALNLLGLLYQASGNHRSAVKALAQAIERNALDAACHYNIATSYQALREPAAAAAHFKQAIALGLSGRGPEPFLTQNSVIAECIRRLSDPGSLLGKRQEPFASADLAALAENIFLRSAMATTILRGLPLELFLTSLRAALLRLADADTSDPAAAGDGVAGLFCALAQQCFLNEYVYAQGEDETQRAERLRESLRRRVTEGEPVPALLLAAVAAYSPLHSLPGATNLLAEQWPPYADDLLRQQVREPLEEIKDRGAIPVLTPISDETSLKVMRQYEENPYPRWTINPLSALRGRLAADAAAGGGQNILIAGCGTGEHPFDIAQKSPQAKILAVDLSLSSLAYARRKAREEGLRNIEFAQADILNLGGLGRTFDRIEAMGVLHHLADPVAGWRVLLSLLAAGGVMRVGLYSATARRAIVDARALVGERGYRPTAEGIRALRRDMIREKDEPRWKSLIGTVDFYSLSGCRDMFFNVMEHRLTIPEIKTFLDENALSFLGFELDGSVMDKFRQEFPDADAQLNLDHWNTFESANPRTFLRMYQFSVRKGGRSGH
jgi:SAM-dependent methyltransferase